MCRRLSPCSQARIRSLPSDELARLAGADPASFPVTGGCSTVELQPLEFGARRGSRIPKHNVLNVAALPVCLFSHWWATTVPTRVRPLKRRAHHLNACGPRIGEPRKLRSSCGRIKSPLPIHSALRSGSVNPCVCFLRSCAVPVLTDDDSVIAMVNVLAPQLDRLVASIAVEASG